MFSLQCPVLQASFGSITEIFGGIRIKYQKEGYILMCFRAQSQMVRSK